MQKKIRKAVFPVAGLGTRFLPATKAMPKELLPIVDKPLIQYAVEEAIEAGIEMLVFITGRNKRAIEDHFDANIELDIALRSAGKIDQANKLKKIIPPHVSCVFVRQPFQMGLGHAVLCAKPVIEQDPFAVILADDFIPRDEGNATLNLANAHKNSGLSQLSTMVVSDSEISKYGIVMPGKKKNSVAGLIEKPSFDDAPSNIASIGRYILDSEIFSILEDIEPGTGGEIQLADAINVLAEAGKCEFVNLQQLRFDCGSVSGYVRAINNEFAKKNFSSH